MHWWWQAGSAVQGGTLTQHNAPQSCATIHTAAGLPCKPGSQPASQPAHAPQTSAKRLCLLRRGTLCQRLQPRLYAQP